MNIPAKLKYKHGYTRYPDRCKNCVHHQSQENYGGVEGQYADTCHIDAAQGEEVHILNTPWGMCDDHKRKRK